MQCCVMLLLSIVSKPGLTCSCEDVAFSASATAVYIQHPYWEVFLHQYSDQCVTVLFGYMCSSEIKFQDSK